MFWWKKKVVLKLRWKIELVVTFGVTLLLNGLAGSTTLLGGVNTAQVSDSYPNLFAPAGLTFSIWGVIYLLLAGYIAYVFFGRNKASVLPDEQFAKVTKLLVANFVLNSLWILTWQHKALWLSVILIVGILVTLIYIVNELRTIPLRGKEFVLARLPFSVYLGWITIATIANVTTWLVSVNWDGAGVRNETWMVIVLLLAAAIGIVTTLRNHDIAYMAVFVWAYFGILFKHLSADGFDGRYHAVLITLTILLAVFLSVIVQLAGQLWLVKSPRK